MMISRRKKLFGLDVFLQINSVLYVLIMPLLSPVLDYKNQ